MHRYFASVSSRSYNTMPVARRKEIESIRQLSAGESTAWAQLIDRWGPYIYNYLLYNAVGEAEAPKLMQEIFSEVIQVFATALRVANLAILIFAITYHHVLHYRQQHREFKFRKQLPSGASDPGDDLQASNFFHAFQQFAPEVQQILLLHYLYGISLGEVAQIVGQSETALAKTLYHAKLYLQ